MFGTQASHWLEPIIAPFRLKLLFLIGLGMFSSILALTPPYLTKLVIDDGLMAGDRSALITWSLALLGLGMLALALGAVNSLIHMHYSVSMLAQLRGWLVHTVLKSHPGWRSNQQTGDLLSRLDGDAGEVQQFAFNALLTGLSSMFRLIGGVAMLMVLNWQLGLIAMVLAPIEGAFLAWARPKTENHARAVRTQKGKFASRLAEMLHGLVTIRMIGAEGASNEAILRDQTGLNRDLLSAQRWGEFTRAIPQALSAVMRAAIFLIGGLMVLDGRWPLGSLIAFLSYLGFMTGPMQSLLGLWHAQARAKASLSRLNELVQETHQNHPPLNLSNIDGESSVLDLPEAAKIRLAGPSGCGKTRFLSNFRFPTPTLKGVVRLHGMKLEDWSLEELRRDVAFVPQVPFLIRGTVRENLTLINTESSETEQIKCLELVGLLQRFTGRQRKGECIHSCLDVMIGETGLTLSGGERQRLCLARALLTKFSVLILDEALSEVDPEQVGRIIKIIDAKWCHTTRIITTHGMADAHGAFDMVIELPEHRALEVAN
ncbi:ABC transporter ATP-binding protein [Pseudovibrio axinellae]|uniref:ABC transporter ATP-binding protein n=1 Tax=Pseudovibrio axinellae TaxID=989403 RepID=UPI00137A2EE5|nr:ABC transporter ATP-binding protein [Pseudovibrio axinellae]